MKYEYSTQIVTNLSFEQSPFVQIPYRLLKDKNTDKYKVGIFSYLLFRKGIDNLVIDNLNNIVLGIGYKPAKNKGCMNDKCRAILKVFRDDYGYINFSDNDIAKPSNIFFKIQIYYDKILDDINHERFSILYLDEFEKMKTVCSQCKTIINVASTMLVYSYIKLMISQRPNKFQPYQNSMTVEERKISQPESYNSYYKDIAEDLGVSPNSVSKAVDALVELKLIALKRLPRKLYTDNKWVRQHLIFALYEKREKGKLYAQGEDYYKNEIENKISLLKKKRIIQGEVIMCGDK